MGLKGEPLNSIHGNIILIAKPDKDITRKENHIPISLTKTGAKLLNITLSK
jgi:hypothetical protein